MYVGACRVIGTPTEVTFRRELEDTDEVIGIPSELEGCRKMLSGSYREGFRFKSSDRDVMLWPPDHKVICEMTQSTFYRPLRHTIISMDTSDTPMGFSRLQLLTPSRERMFMSSVVESNNAVYISSSLLLQRFHHSMTGLNPLQVDDNMHGPCHNFTYRCQEADFAHVSVHVIGPYQPFHGLTGVWLVHGHHVVYYNQLLMKDFILFLSQAK
jgi:hypothetical protein